MRYYTDYPIAALGDAPGRVAPVREVVIQAYDGDKYVLVSVEGVDVTLKAGYVYTRRVRAEEAERRRLCVPAKVLRRYERPDPLGPE